MQFCKTPYTTMTIKVVQMLNKPQNIMSVFQTSNLDFISFAFIKINSVNLPSEYSNFPGKIKSSFFQDKLDSEFSTKKLLTWIWYNLRTFNFPPITLQRFPLVTCSTKRSTTFSEGVLPRSVQHTSFHSIRRD